MKSQPFTKRSFHRVEQKHRIVLKPVAIFLLLFLFITSLSAQEKYTLSGVLSAQQTGEKIIGASVTVGSTSVGTSSNEYGFYSLTLPKGTYSVHVDAVGFTAIVMDVHLDKDTILNI